MYFPMILHSNYALELKVSKNALKLMQLHCKFQGVKITPLKVKNYSLERSN